VFNSILPHFPPDFRFDDDTFLSDPAVELIEENVPSLANWDCQDSKSLLHVICELLALYRKYQVSVNMYKVAKEIFSLCMAVTKETCNRCLNEEMMWI
jgi:hypothetical protein